MLRTGAGIIGSSGVGRFHADALRRLGVPVAGLAAANPQLAAADAQAMNLSPDLVFSSAHELIASPNVSVVHVCTPNALHAALCRAAIATGKHVVVEKPLTTSSTEAGQLLELAIHAGVVHGLCHNYRYYSMLQALRALIARGDLGRVRTFRAAWLLEELLTIDRRHWMLDPAQMGPAVTLADVGVHLWDLVEHILPVRINAVLCHTQKSAHGTGDEAAAVVMRCDDGVVGSGLVSQAVPGHGNTVTLEIIGDQASAEWDIRAADRLTVRELGGRCRVLERGTAEVAALGVTTALPAGQPEGHLDATRELLARIYRHIDGDDRSEHPTFADGLRGLRILEALLDSARDERWTTINQG